MCFFVFLLRRQRVGVSLGVSVQFTRSSHLDLRKVKIRHERISEKDEVERTIGAGHRLTISNLQPFGAKLGQESSTAPGGFLAPSSDAKEPLVA